ncbi:zinc alcohol dehydrogenase [Stemphylium lycopersici]|nr:zinc alcohol dehydrogenase [Stemphylium lycopersici]
MRDKPSSPSEQNGITHETLRLITFTKLLVPAPSNTILAPFNSPSSVIYHLSAIQMSTTMRGWQFQASSKPFVESLSISPSGIPIPSIKDDEVLVESYATGLNAIDYKILELGLITRLVFPSLTPGLDIHGRVAKIGSKVSKFREGDIVFGGIAPGSKHGALAEYLPVSQDTLAKAPEGLKRDDFVAIASVGMTVLAGLQPHAKPGNKVFINGGSGGTGVAAVQIAKILGYDVTASCSTANVDLVKSLGADTVLDYKSAPIVDQLKDSGAMFDLILDNVGEPANLYRVSSHFLRPEGKFYQVGLGMNLSAGLQFFRNKLAGLLNWGKREYVFITGKSETAVYEQLGAWMADGKLRAVIDSTWEFEDVPKAYERLKTGRAKGKVVVHVKDE